MRRATTDDASALAHVQTETWRSSYPNPALGTTHDAVEAKLAAFNDGGEERLRGVLRDPSGRTWVACDGEVVVGFVGVRTNAETNIVEALHVLPSHQGRGIGRTLLETALAWLGASKPVALDVVAYNTRAVQLYESCGFTRRTSAGDSCIILGDGARIPLVRMIKE